MDIEISGDCIGKRCGYSIFERRVGCTSGNGTCRTVSLLEADPSDFHDQSLIDATRAIKEILAGISPPQDRTLSFLHTNLGTLLAWVEHGANVPATAVTDASSDEEVAEALGLILNPTYPVQSS